MNNPHWESTFEVVNDKDHFIANVWRALRNDPEMVAYHCDYPLVEIDFHLWKLWLVNEGKNRIKKCGWDEDHYDAEVAGKWIYVACNTIGRLIIKGGWTREAFKLSSELGIYNSKDLKEISPEVFGNGVCRERPVVVAPQGVNRKSFDDDTSSVFANVFPLFPARKKVYQYIRVLSERMRNVKVCCGDWERVVQPAVIFESFNKSKQITGIFLDPPYSEKANRKKLYNIDSFDVAHEVRKWAIENSDNPRLRIALCGYTGEHEGLEEYGFVPYFWRTQGGMATFAKKREQGKINKGREVIWFSRYCLNEGLLASELRDC